MWDKVQRTDDCWLWTGPVDNYGYGYLKIDGRTRGVHRHIYETLVGPVPDGLVIDHLCRVRRCLRPEHLEPVTQRTNILRGVSNSARNAVATHCIHGHEFTPENTYVYSGPGWRSAGRQCRACRSETQARYKARKKVA